MELLIELTSAEDAAREWREHLSSGGAFVPGATASHGDTCTVVLVDQQERRLELAAHAVYTCAEGVGVQLDEWCADLRTKVQAWIESVTETEKEEEKEEKEEEEEEDEALRDPLAKNVFERLRNLPIAEQLKVAREGEVHERKALERLYGKTVWEALLRNQRLTLPEVARIARMGALPKPQIEQIVGNTAWLRSPEVRRALLQNLRLAAEQIPRILRLLPKHELRLVPMQTAYPAAVREAARRLLKEMEK